MCKAVEWSEIALGRTIGFLRLGIEVENMVKQGTEHGQCGNVRQEWAVEREETGG